MPACTVRNLWYSRGGFSELSVGATSPDEDEMDKQSPAGVGMLEGNELLAALDEPALIVDRDGIIVQVNSAAQSLGAPDDSAMRRGAHLSDLLPGVSSHWPDSVQGFDTRQGIECSEMNARVRVRAPLCSRDGVTSGWLVLLHAEDEVELRSAQRLRSLLASLDDIVFVIDLDGCIVEYHQPASDDLQSSNGWMVGTRYQDLLPDATARKYTEIMNKVRTTGQLQRFDHQLVVDGEERWYAANIGLLRGQDQEISGFVVVARNVTKRKRIETAEREQRVLAEALQDVALALNSTLHLPEIWKRILANVVRVVPADAAAILLVEDGIAHMVGERGYSERGLGRFLAGYEIEVASLGRLRYMTETRQPCLIPDTWAYENWLRRDPAVNPVEPNDKLHDWARSYLGAPIVLDEEVIGFIKLESTAPNYFTPRDGERLRAFGDHAASAIRNARLYAQAQELAAVHERQRLARELHDAVSQMLFSAKIIAEMLPRLHERDPDSVWTYLPELQRLIQGAMGEMRMLLLELRPAILTDVELDVLLGYLVDAASGRTSARITLAATDVCGVPHDVQIALYRIAQEALSNAVKHAHAANIHVSCRCDKGQALLRIQDDGRGFNEADVRPENLGLGIMRERAAEIGASLRIHGAPEGGMAVEAAWPTAGQGR